MKKTLYFFFVPMALFFAACGGGQPTENPEEKEKAAAEIKAADSLTTEMDNIQAEMEAKNAELKDALDALEPKK